MMQEMPLTDSDFNMWTLLTRTRHAIYRAEQKELSGFGISPEESAVLFAIYKIVNDSAIPTPAEISRRIFRESQSVSAIIDRMVQEGLVKKVRDLDKKNLVRVVVTEKGQHAFEESTKRTALHKIMASLSEEEYQQLSLSLKKLFVEALGYIGMADRLPYLLPR